MKQSATDASIRLMFSHS